MVMVNASLQWLRKDVGHRIECSNLPFKIPRKIYPFSLVYITDLPFLRLKQSKLHTALLYNNNIDLIFVSVWEFYFA